MSAAVAVAPAGDRDAALIERARAIAATLQARAMEIDDLARVPDDVVAALAEAGVLTMGLPAAFGGTPVRRLATMLEVYRAIASGDAGVGWAVMIMTGITGGFTRLFPASVREEVLATPGGARVTGTQTPRVFKGRQSEAGLHIDHAVWSFNSGIHLANWDMLGVPLFDAAGAPAGAGLAMVPIADIHILNDWDTIGLRGSGSSSIELRDVLIPAHRIVDFMAAMTSPSPAEAGDDAWLLEPPPLTLGNIFFAALALGAAEAALKLFLDGVARRAITHTVHATQAGATIVQLAVAEASARIDAAAGILLREIEVLDAAARTGTPPPDAERIRLRAQVALATRMLWKAIDGIADASGGSLAARSNLIGRFWRDVKVITLHGQAAPTSNVENYGSTLCGQAPTMPVI